MMYTISTLYDDALTVVATASFTPIIIVLLLSSYIVYRKSATSSRKLPFPPGPRPWPLIGNALDMPRTAQWSTFMKWAEEYGTWMIFQHVHPCSLLLSHIAGDIVYVTVLGQPMVILNTINASLDLLQDRSSNYSDRLLTPMLTL